MLERLQKIVARAGIASRRAAEELVAAGRVRVNGRVVTELGAKADPHKDRIEVDGKRLVAEEHVYLVLHKPRNVVATLSDPEGRPTVAEYVKGAGARVYPVGRLDFGTSGVLLFTNDGELANALLHPKGGVPKTYVLKVAGEMTEHDLDHWRRGVVLEDGKTLPAEARLLRLEGDKTWFELTIREGRNQQIRRMGEATGFRVMRLARLSFAGIGSEGLRPGEWRPLTRDELLELRKVYGVPRGGGVRAAPTSVAKPRGPGPRALLRRDESPQPEARARSGEHAVRSARSARSGTTPRGAGSPAPRARAPGGRSSRRGPT